MQHKNDEAMDEKTKELLAQARKMKKQMEDGSFPFEDVLENNVCSGMYDNLHTIRSMMVSTPKPKNQKTKKEKK